jgi:outer membrane protein insertion porin family
VQLFSLFELEYPLLREAGLKWVAFYDIGNAFARLPGTRGPDGATERFSLRHDAGFGIRWFSPIGPLRFEWGIPINRRAGEQPIVFEFTIGNTF